MTSIGGFQNHLHSLYGLPGGFFSVAVEEVRRKSNDDNTYQPKWRQKEKQEAKDLEPIVEASEVQEAQVPAKPKLETKKPSLSQLSLATLSTKAIKKVEEVQSFVNSPKVHEILAAIELEAFNAAQERIALERLEQELKVRNQIETEINRRASLRQKQMDFAQAEQDSKAIKARRLELEREEDELALLYVMLDDEFN